MGQVKGYYLRNCKVERSGKKKKGGEKNRLGVREKKKHVCFVQAFRLYMCYTSGCGIYTAAPGFEIGNDGCLGAKFVIPMHGPMPF